MYSGARDREAAMLARCTLAARGVSLVNAHDGEEANVFRVAAMVLQSRNPAEARSLRAVAERYFAAHPRDVMPVASVVRSANVISLPRLRDMLAKQLARK